MSPQNKHEKGGAKPPPEKKVKFTEAINSYDLDEGETQNPVKQVNILTGQHTHRNLVEAQMEGNSAFRGSGYSHNASVNSEKAWIAREPVNCTPPQKIRVARFPKDKREPEPVRKETVDIKANEHQYDLNLGHIPDFREDWGGGKEWENYRRAYCVYVAPRDIPEPQLHGWYVVFYTWDPKYEKNTHKLFEGCGRHVHEDVFIAKIERKPDSKGWTVYVDMPDEFFWATPKEDGRIYRIRLAESNRSMLGPLIGL